MKDKHEIIERLKNNKNIGFTDLEPLGVEAVADLVLAYDLILWEKLKGEDYREACRNVGEVLERYWREEE